MTSTCFSSNFSHVSRLLQACFMKSPATWNITRAAGPKTRGTYPWCEQTKPRDLIQGRGTLSLQDVWNSDRHQMLSLSRFLIQLRRLFTMLRETSKRLAEHFKYISPTVWRFSVFGLWRNLWEHSSTLLIASDRLVWTSAQRWHHVTERATNWPRHTLQHTIFIAPCCFDHLVSGENVKWIGNQ